MSRTPYFFVEKFNSSTNKYELQHPFVWDSEHKNKIAADLFPYNGCHDLFSIVEEGNTFARMKGIHHHLPHDVSQEIKEQYVQNCEVFEMSGEKRSYSPTVRWFTYSDMYIYCLENQQVLDYDAMSVSSEEKEIFMPNPLEALKKRVDAFLEVIDDYDWQDNYSLIRIVYWIE